MSSHFDIYAQSLTGKGDLVDKVGETVSTFQQNVLANFNYISDHQVLLYGDVQSGKTSHMLGIVADCLDRGFRTVIVLTSPNTRLVQQTYDRVFESLSNVLVCKADSLNDFRSNRRRVVPQQTVIVIGKIPGVLDNWLQIFKETGALKGNPILIIDDEADATSLNTKVNADDISKINGQLTQIRQNATGCIYMQVTGTPQAILLQSEESGWATKNTIHFKPGDNYIGGKVFFDSYPNSYTRMFSDSEFDEELNLRTAVLTHMVTCAMFKIAGKDQCNMVVHPSHLSPIHDFYATDVQKIVEDTFSNFESQNIHHALASVYSQLAETYPDAPTLDEVTYTLSSMQDSFNFLIVNSINKTIEADWASGFNFIIGGNSLGRGLTFDNLQTIFYVRESKRPQADTVWQHARMFGYKRHKPTIRCFMPATLAKMFHEVHQGNEILKMQLEAGTPAEELRVVLDGSISPTRGNVLDKRRVGGITGGVNYFAADPVNSAFESLDAKIMDLVSRHGDDFELGMQAVIGLTHEFDTDPDDLDLATFRVALENYAVTQPHLTARVVVRTGRKVNHGKGTLLSPTDQKISKNESIHPLMILYRIEGVNANAVAQGNTQWSRDPIWVPSIMIPEQRQFWRVS